MNRRELEDAIRSEVAHWPGVTVDFMDGGKHPKAKFKFGEMVLSRPYSGSPSDSAFGVHACLGDMRRVMKQLGASRDKPEPSKDEDEAPYRKPNKGAAARPDPVARQPVRHNPGLTDQLAPILARREFDHRLTQFTDAVLGRSQPASADVARAEKVLGVAIEDSVPVSKDSHAVTVVLGGPVGVSDEPAGKLLRQLVDRGFDLHMQVPFTRAEVIGTASTMIVDGIYFGLPDEVYHNVPRLGATSLIKLNSSPGDFWNGSWLDPDRKDEADEDEVKAWKVTGRAYHCARLEPDQFEVRYCRKPAKADYAEQAAQYGACWNGTDIGNALADLGATKKSAGESVADQGQRLEDMGYEGVIWPLVQARAEREQGERIALDAKVWDQIARDMERLRGSKEIASKFTDKGASEVSVFWTDENNIQRKARFDRLEPDYWLDFKTFDNSRGKRLEQAINDAIRYNRYYVTAASYREGYIAIRQLQVIGTANEVEQHLIARIQISPKDPRMWFVFQQKSGVPNLLGREFVFHDVPQSIETDWDTGADDAAVAAGHAATERPTQIYAKGRTEVDYAKRLFALYSGVYRPGEPWAPLEPMARISDMDFSPGWLEGRYE